MLPQRPDKGTGGSVFACSNADSGPMSLHQLLKTSRILSRQAYMIFAVVEKNRQGNPLCKSHSSTMLRAPFETKAPACNTQGKSIYSVNKLDMHAAAITRLNLAWSLPPSDVYRKMLTWTRMSALARFSSVSHSLE
eukprot:261772-Pyramimonas_sp.AAC.2